MATTAASPPQESETPPRFTHREILVTMSGLVIAMLLAMLDNMIVAPALPTIVGDLGGLNHLAWVTTGYVLASTVATPIWGKLGDIFGRRLTFLSSIVIFLVGSALCGASQNMNELIGFRALQGLGAGGLMVGVMAVIAEIIPPRERGKYQGVMMAVMPVAMIGGPLVGGYITDNLTWRWAFYVNLPLGVIAIGVCWFTLAKLRSHLGREQVKIDWTGTGLLTVWIVALVLIASWGGSQYKWASAPIGILAVVAVVGFVAFLRVEQRAADPVMPLRVFRNLNFTLSGVLNFIVGFAMFGGINFLPQYQQFVQGDSATNSGLLLMPMMLAAMVVSLACGQFITRTGRYRLLPAVGSLLMAVGLALFATMGLDTSRTLTSVYMIFLGAGMGFLMQTTMLIAQNSVELKIIGAATGAATFVRNMGGSLGLSILGSIYANKLEHSFLAHGGAALLKSGAGSAAGAGGGSVASMTPKLMRTLPAEIQHAFMQAVTDGVRATFLWGTVIAVVGAVVALFIRHVPLRGFGDSAGPAEPSGDAAPEGAEPAPSAG